ncbi:MAG: pilus assembly PilX N-terminal domain-containing protein [Patescibacteria group bacterium]
MSSKRINNLLNNNHGFALVMLLVFSTIFIMLLVAASAYVVSQAKVTNAKIREQKTLEIAEAGVTYYRWHLAHVTDDFTDGTGESGPYVHDYYDLNGNIIGQYSLNIIPPISGSNIVTVESTGYLNESPDIKRTIALKLGNPSFSSFAVVANDEMRFGEGTEIWGPVHSNDGIRFDGYAHNIVSSTKDKYDDPDHMGPEEFGVHTHVSPTDPLPPAAVPARSDVFGAGRLFPVAPVDFDGITADLSDLKTKAIANGIYLGASGAQGYHIKFNANDTVDITRVTAQSQCSYRWWFWWYSYSDMWSIGTQSSFTYNGQSSIGLPMPTNQIIFVEDDAWIDGKIDGQRVTVVAAREPLASASATIVVNNDLTYTNYDGSDVIGLIAQTDVSVGFYSEDNLRIDAAVIAQNGRVGRYYYADRSGYTQNPAGCASNVYRDTLTLFGSLASNQRYGFAYTDGTGYEFRNLDFDSNLYYAPPPNFPTVGEYTIISWEEK